MKPYDLFLLPLYMFVFLCGEFCEMSLEFGVCLFSNLIKLRYFSKKRLFLTLNVLNFPPLPKDINQKGNAQCAKEGAESLHGGGIKQKIHTGNSMPTSSFTTCIMLDPSKQSR